MHIIKLNAIDSTNTFLKQISSADLLDDYTTVITKHQTHGKGQRGSSWQSENSKNLTFSTYKKLENFSLKNQFLLSVVTSLAVLKTLKYFDIPKLHIKWPNDILSEKNKLCGILIENTLVKTKINYSIIGVGINVNQTNFNNLPKATSMKLVNGKTYDLDEVLSVFLIKLKYFFSILNNNKHDQLIEEYHSYLFRKNKPSTFKNSLTNNLFSGFIKGIDSNGNLILQLEDNIEKSFSLKEVALLY